jgi:hypothetical protein
MKKPIRPPALKDLKKSNPADVVPAGWFSRFQLESEWGLSQSYTIDLIRDAVVAGKAEMKKFRVPTSSRGLYPTPHYRFL